MNCIYCKKPDEHAICVYCDGKHTARGIFRHVSVERAHYAKQERLRFFDSMKMKSLVTDRDIKGLEGLSDEERKLFFKAFEAEYSRLGAE